MSNEKDLDVIFERLGQVPLTEIDQAFTMPGCFYTSEAVLDLEREQLFRKKWICLAREEEIPTVGDYLATQLADEPVVLIRIGRNQVKALSNVCRHRGMPLVEGTGNLKKFTCSYHAWTYDLNGKLLRAPGVDEHHSEFLEKCRLPEFQCESWHGFIFVNLDAGASSFLESETVRDIEPMVEHMHIEDMRLIFSAEQEWDANWKCLVENFLEGYHLSTVHRDTLHPFTPTRLSKYFNAGDGYFGYYSYYPDDAPSRGTAHPDLADDERRRSLMLGIAPSSVFGISGFKVTYNLIQPVSPTRLRTRIGMIGIPSKNDEERKMAAAGVDLFTRTFAEDEIFLVKAMRGLQSGSYQSSVLAKRDYEGTIWDFYSYLASNLTRPSL